MSKETKSESSTGLSYKDAGVDINKANELIKDISKLAAGTHRPGVIGGIGGFSALFEVPLDRYKHPVLVSSTDGVGTKLKLAIESKHLSGIGIDLVAMCANDILCQGAEPLYFLDYYATGKLQLEPSRVILSSIARGCEQANMALAGGETAELPGMYQGNDFDLAGFCVGIVEKDKIIDGSKVKAGDPLLAIASSGPHSNGYSLIRRVLAAQNITINDQFIEMNIGRALLEPTRIYVKSVTALLKKIDVLALAHITGGGLIENVPRVLPENTQAVIDTTTWKWPDIFHWLQEKGNIDMEEMYRTFNLGVGMILCLAEENLAQALKILNAAGETAWLIGHVATSDYKEPSVLLRS